MDEDKMIDRLNAPRISELQLRELRAKYFTVRHETVKECGHQIDILNEPRHRNCETCWFLWFEVHPDLVTTADKAYIEQGAVFLDKMRGKQFRKMFCSYMITKLALQKEKEKNEQRGEIQSDSSIGEEPRQELRGDDIPATRGSSEPTSTPYPNEPVVS